VGGPIVAVAIAVWLIFPAWGPVPFAGVDVTAHVMRVTFAVEQLVARGRLDGWSPDSFLGFQHFLFRGPGMAWLVAAVHALAFGRLTILEAFNAVVLGSFVAFPLAVVFLAGSFGLGWRAAGIAAVLALVVSYALGNGLEGLFGVGLVENTVGAIFVALALGAMVRVAAEPRTSWVLLAGVSLAVLVLTHLVSALVLVPLAALCLPWFLPAGPRLRSSLAGLLLCGALAAGLVAFWLVPCLAHQDLRGDVPGWVKPALGERVRAILGGKLLFRPGVGWAVLAGWAYVLLHAGRAGRRAVGLVLAPALYLLFAHGSAWLVPGQVTNQFLNRGLGYAGVLATFPLAVLLAAATRPSAVGDTVAIAIAACLVVLPLGPVGKLAAPGTDPPAVMHEAAAVLRRVVPPGARFATSRKYPASVMVWGFSGPDRWLSWRSGRYSLTGLATESTVHHSLATDLDALEQRAPEKSADWLARRGVTHVVTASDALADKLLASPRFKAVWRTSPLAIVEVRAAPRRPAPASLVTTTVPARAAMREDDPGRLRFKVRTAEPTTAELAVAWSPKWRATLHGLPHPVERTPDALLKVGLPAGDSVLRLEFGADGWDWLGRLITVGTIGAVLVGLLRRRWLP
jgi:hypothetical protein